MPIPRGARLEQYMGRKALDPKSMYNRKQAYTYKEANTMLRILEG